ncbi:MAG: hypothetical protein ACE5H4_13230 [Candidatus Thorarchaeota archaeon]
MVEVTEGGFVIVVESLWRGDLDGIFVSLVRTDENGNHMWNHAYAGSGWDKAHSATECSNADFAVSGTFDFQGSNGSDM